VNVPHPVPPALADLIAERFQLLSEPMRIRILDVLRDGPLSVGAIAAVLEGSQQNVSKHLGLLLRAGIVSRRKEHTTSLYEIADLSVLSLCELVCGGLQRRLEAQWSLVTQEAAAR
jgi:DNA-binding transcriptional ArsR family regulator